MDKSDDNLPTEAERYVMPSRFVESDSLEVQGFVTSALRDLPVGATNRDKAIRLFEAVRVAMILIVSRWMRTLTVPAVSLGRKRRFAFPRQFFWRLVCVLWVSPPLWGSRMCATT